MSKTLEALVYIQGRLKAPKDQKSNRYSYRNIEDINEAVKPLAAEHGCAVVYTDEFRDGLCISTCMLMGPDSVPIQAQGVSMINTKPQHMSIEQSSGAASSYARKYAAQGLFAIDSSENDPDRTQGSKGASPTENQGGRDALRDAQQRLWTAVKAYAEKSGGDAEKLAAGCKDRPDYQETPAWYNLVAQEFETA